MNTLPGPAMLDSKLFVSRRNGPFLDLYECLWDGVEWIWVNHGRLEGVEMCCAPGAAMLEERLFVPTEDGSLCERRWRGDLGRWVWENHGRPGVQAVPCAGGDWVPETGLNIHGGAMDSSHSG
jgi:hypothetical protein